LGLPIVKQIVSEHRGTVEYISEAGKGTAFIISLPLDVRVID
jgi:signal transduction histidine kinase